MIAGWSSLVARRAHNPKVVGSNPTPATLEDPDFLIPSFVFCVVLFIYIQICSNVSK